MLDVLIVEDELKNAESLQLHLSSWPGKLNILGVLRSNKEIREWVAKNNQPDLVFCDIELLDGNVFSVLQDDLFRCPIIFTTAYNSFYQEAFDSNGIGYLLKPIGYKKLDAALNKVISLGLARDELVNWPEFLKNLGNLRKSYRERIVIKGSDGMKVIHTAKIVHIETNGGVCQILHSGSKIFEYRYKISDLAEELDPATFFMVNRGEIVNIKFIENIQPFYENRLSLTMTGLSKKVITAKSATHSFRKWLNDF